MPRRLIAAVIVLVLVAALIAALRTGGGSSHPIGTKRFATYRISYEVRFTANGQTTVRTEDLSVRRPFEGFDLTKPASGGPSSGTISTDTALYDIRNDSTVIFVGGRQPGPPSGDQDLETQLPDMVARKLAKDLGTTQHIAGRACRDFRFFEPPSGPIKPLKGDTEHDDICIADGGLVLSEGWTVNGEVAFVRTATRISRRAAPLPSVDHAITVSQQGARVGKGARSFIATPPRPTGYRARPAISITVPGGGPGAASVVWSFSSGARTIFVEAGGPSAKTPWQNGDTTTKRVRSKHLGAATTAIRSDGAEIRVALSRGRWVRIRGTVPLRFLLRYADGLRLR